METNEISSIWKEQFKLPRERILFEKTERITSSHKQVVWSFGSPSENTYEYGLNNNLIDTEIRISIASCLISNNPNHISSELPHNCDYPREEDSCT